jgi:hypothetical protein
MITAVDILVLIAIVGTRIWFGGRASSTVDPISFQEDSDPAVARARGVVGWADGSRMDWDRHVRPVLARELAELTRGRRSPGERMLGPELWPLVDPEYSFDAPDEPGPGRDGLARVLDRLERL